MFVPLILLAGVVLGETPTALSQDLIAARCSKFSSQTNTRQNPNVDPTPLVYTHVPKAGGGSMQLTLTHELEVAAEVAGRDGKELLCNVHTQKNKNKRQHITTGRLNCNGARMLVGQLPVAKELGNAATVDWPGAIRSDTLLVTLLREPKSRIESAFRFHAGKGQAFVESVQARGGDLQVEFQKYVNDTKLLTFVWWLHAPPGMNVSEEKKMSDEQLLETREFIIHRYNVVGVLDRIEETLEVMRCRIPWFNGHTMLESATTDKHAQTWEYPIKLAHPPILKEATRYERELYELSNELLTGDLQCCRRAAKRGEGSKKRNTTI